MPVLKIDFNKPDAFFEVLKKIGIKEGTKLEIEKVKEGILLKPVDTLLEEKIASLPPQAKTAEERNRIIKLMEGNRETDEGDIPIDEIIAFRTTSELKASLDD